MILFDIATTMVIAMTFPNHPNIKLSTSGTLSCEYTGTLSREQSGTLCREKLVLFAANRVVL